MPDYPNAGHDGTELQEKISAKHDAVVAAFGQPAAPYVYQEYPKAVSKTIDGVKVEATVYSKAEEDSFLEPPAVVAEEKVALPAAPDPPVLSATE